MDRTVRGLDGLVLGSTPDLAWIQKPDGGVHQCAVRDGEESRMYAAGGHVLQSVIDGFKVCLKTVHEYVEEDVAMGTGPTRVAVRILATGITRIIRVSDFATVFEERGVVESIPPPAWAASTGFIVLRVLPPKIEHQFLGLCRSGWGSASLGAPVKHPIFPLWLREQHGGIALVDSTGSTVWLVVWEVAERDLELDSDGDLLYGDDLDVAVNEFFRWSLAGDRVFFARVSIAWT